MIGTLLVLAPLFSELPKAVLGAVIIDAVVFGMIDVPEIRRLRRVSRFDFWIAVAAIVGVLSSGVLAGVVIGVVLSLGWLVYVATRPPMPLLGREAGTQVFRDLDENPGDETFPGIAVLRLDGGLFFATAEALEDRVRELADGRPSPPRARPRPRGRQLRRLPGRGEDRGDPQADRSRRRHAAAGAGQAPGSRGAPGRRGRRPDRRRPHPRQRSPSGRGPAGGSAFPAAEPCRHGTEQMAPAPLPRGAVWASIGIMSTADRPTTGRRAGAEAEPAKSRKPWIWLSALLAVVAAGLLIWALTIKSDLDSANQELDSTQQQLADKTEELDSTKAQLDATKQDVEEMPAQADKGVGTGAAVGRSDGAIQGVLGAAGRHGGGPCRHREDVEAAGRPQRRPRRMRGRPSRQPPTPAARPRRRRRRRTRRRRSSRPPSPGPRSWRMREGLHLGRRGAVRG